MYRILFFTGHFVRGCLNSDASKGCKVTDKTAQWITNVRFKYCASQFDGRLQNQMCHM